MGFQLGIEVLLKDSQRVSHLKGRRVGLLAHPASVNSELVHSLDLLMSKGINVTCAFGPQHGMRGEKQDNMIESADYVDPVHKIPVFSLYGEVRRPTPKMLDAFDIILVDLQDVGCRIYTFLTTLFYLLEDLNSRKGKELWVCDRPNPAGRPIEGQTLDMKFASFVGAAPLPMRHGLTLGEAALWYRDFKKLNVEVKVISMQGYSMTSAPGFGWDERKMVWVNPSPNMPRLTTARMYAGTVLLEGTHISEGRGTTRPLENFGAPSIDSVKVLERMNAKYPEWLKGCRLRPAYFEPTFHKYKGQLVNAIQIHTDDKIYDPQSFKPYRLISAYLQSVRAIYPDMKLWLDPPYEYEKVHLPIDILSGDSRLREWCDAGDAAGASDLERGLVNDETRWAEVSSKYHLYS